MNKFEKQINYIKLPPTVFPSLYNNIFSPDNQFNKNREEIFFLNQAVGKIFTLRQYAIARFVNEIRQIDNIFNLNPQSLIKKLFPFDSDENFHQRIYLYYIIGIYKEASNEMHAYFEYNFQSLSSEIKKLNNDSNTFHYCNELYHIISEDDFIASNAIEISNRVKEEASLFSKSLITGKLKIVNFFINEIKFDQNLWPYDLLGIRIIYKNIPSNKKRELTNYLSKKLSNLFNNVQIRQVLSPNFMFRSAIVGYIIKDNFNYPFQIQIRDANADRYETLSYGNYKMNKIWKPYIDNWYVHLDNPNLEKELPFIVLNELRTS